MKGLFPLADETRFGIVHHRKLNSPDGLDSVRSAQTELPQYVHIAEGDVCWTVLDGEIVPYLYHPDRLIDLPSDDELRVSRDEGRLWSLERALEPQYEDLIFIAELKIGRGSRRRAIAGIAEMLESRKHGRFWIDTFSLRDSKTVKETCPTVATSLHVNVLLGGWTLKTAFELFPVSLRRRTKMEHLDVLTLTYGGSFQQRSPWGWASTERTVERVAEGGKHLVYGGVRTQDMFRRVSETGVKAAYIKFPWEDLVERNRTGQGE